MQHLISFAALLLVMDNMLSAVSQHLKPDIRLYFDTGFSFKINKRSVKLLTGAVAVRLLSSEQRTSHCPPDHQLASLQRPRVVDPSGTSWL